MTALLGGELQRAQQKFGWRIRLSDLLGRQPEAEHELRALISNVETHADNSADPVKQHVIGSEQAQQAVQRHGIQVNTFGGQYERGVGR